jgi:uncharacterized membrane protein
MNPSPAPSSSTPSPWSEDNLSVLNRHSYFRVRGEATTRLETFVDAAFAFALTMLVISVDDVPRSYDEFADALLTIPAFVASFFQVIMFWLGHRNWSQRYGLEDRVAISLSLILVCGILVIVFPLRVVFGAAFGYFSGGVLPYPFPVEWAEMRQVFVIYGSGFWVMCSLIALLYMHALRRRKWLNLNAAEILLTRSKIIFWLIPAGTGLGGLLIALFISEEMVIFAGLIYCLLFVLLPAHAVIERRYLRKLDL